MFVEGTKNGNYRSVSIAHSLRGAFFLGWAAPAVAGAGYTWYIKNYIELGKLQRSLTRKTKIRIKKTLKNSKNLKNKYSKKKNSKSVIQGT